MVACGKGGLAPPLAATTPRPGHTEETVRARVELEVSGAERITVKREIKLRIVQILGGSNPSVTWFFSVSVGESVKLDDGRLLQFDADLSPGLFEGPGTYTLTDKAGVQLAGKEGLGSAAYIFVVRISPPSGARYDRFAEPCTMTMKERGVSGVVRCPKLGDGKGKFVSTEWSWERI